MARPLPEDFSPEELNIEIVETSSNCTEVFYIPTLFDLKETGIDTKDPSQHKRRIAFFSGQNRFITVYPIFTLPTHQII